MENRDSYNIPFFMQVSVGRFLFATNDPTSGINLLDFFSIGDSQDNERKRGVEPEKLASFRCWKVRHTSYQHEIEQALPDVWVIKRLRPQSCYPVIDKPCSICLSDMNKGQVVRELPCKHTFHKKCIDKWLKQSNKCPVDRSCLD